jgi:hypothetical protein
LSNNNNQAIANDCNILSGYSLQLPQGSGNDVYGLPNVNWVVRSQASEEANMNNTINFPAHVAAAATTSAAKEMNSNGDSPSSTDGKKLAFENTMAQLESAAPIRSRAADRALGNRTSIYRGVTRYILDYRTYLNPRLLITGIGINIVFFFLLLWAVNYYQTYDGEH